MTDGIYLDEGEYGRRATIRAKWRPAMVDSLKSAGIVELELNNGKGYRGDDLRFLSDLPHLRSLRIVTPIDDVEPVHALHELRQLRLMYATTEIRFSEFPLLEDCTLDECSRFDSLFELRTLRRLFINKYKGKSSEPFGRLTKLESLGIFSSSLLDLLGFRPLQNLRSLRLALLSKLESLAGVEKLASLEEFDIEACRRIRTIEPIRSLSRLKRFHLSNCGEIESLKPLNGMPGLEWVTFIESTNIVDGDLSPLAGLEHLSRVAFQNRRHYTHRCEDFGEAYFGKTPTPPA